MRFTRSAGILLHPVSLPGRFGIGDLGIEAFNFIHFLKDCGQTLWQVFPLGPTGYGDSPYQCFSAFAGNSLLISPEKLKEDGFLKEEDVQNVPPFNPHKIDYGAVIEWKKPLIRKAFEAFKLDKHGLEKEYEKFLIASKDWIEDYALFRAAKEYHGGVIWTEWDKSLVYREEAALQQWKKKLEDDINYQKFVQFIFARQWQAVKNNANENGIKIIGDMPIFVAYDSADVWANKHLFSVDKEGKLLTVAGVPPDYFSATGQLWGNPLFNWEEMKKNNFAWWILRMKNILHQVDIIRIDHFRGFDKYWEIPGGAKTAEKGKWLKAPGEELFTTIEKELGELPIIAEDLGLITPSVVKLREKFNFPGMKVLQFAFGTDMETKFLPHNIIPNSAVYTGTHDNDTTRGYFDKAKTEDNDIYEHAQKYLNYFGDNITGELIRTAYRTTADIVVIPMQDVLNLGTEARMNFPGKLGGNWTWRFTWGQVDGSMPATYNRMAKLYERPPIKKKEVEIEDEPD